MSGLSVTTRDNLRRALTLAALFGVSAAVWAAGADLGQAVQIGRAHV